MKSRSTHLCRTWFLIQKRLMNTDREQLFLSELKRKMMNVLCPSCWLSGLYHHCSHGLFVFFNVFLRFPLSTEDLLNFCSCLRLYHILLYLYVALFFFFYTECFGWRDLICATIRIFKWTDWLVINYFDDSWIVVEANFVRFQLLQSEICCFSIIFVKNEIFF